MTAWICKCRSTATTKNVAMLLYLGKGEFGRGKTTCWKLQYSLFDLICAHQFNRTATMRARIITRNQLIQENLPRWNS